MDPTEADSFLNKFKAEIYGKEDYPNFLKNSRIAEMYVGMGRLVQSLDFFENAVVSKSSPSILFCQVYSILSAHSGDILTRNHNV